MRHILKAAVAIALLAGSHGALTAQEAGSQGGQRLTLSAADCRAMALQSSEEMRKSSNEVAMAEMEKWAATTNFLPKIDAMATGTYVSPDMDMMGMKMQMHGMYVAGFQLTQPIYAGGKIVAGHKLSKIGEGVAREQQRLTEMDVIANAETAYWNYVAVLGKVELMRGYSNMLDTLYAQTQTAVEAGMTVKNDLLRVEARRSEIRYQQQKVNNGADLCRMALCQAIGVSFDTEIVPKDSADDSAPSAPGVLSTDIGLRPELHLLEKQVEAKRQMVNLTRGDYLPTVGLSAGWNWYGNIKLNSMVEAMPGVYVPYTQKFENGLGMVMLAVKVPLVRWGEGVKKVKKAKLEAENAQLDFDRNRRLLSLEARQAAANVEDGFAMIESANVAMRQAAENLRVTHDRYEERMCPLSDMLDAQTQWQKASADVIEARAQYRIYLTNYLKATGKL